MLFWKKDSLTGRSIRNFLKMVIETREEAHSIDKLAEDVFLDLILLATIVVGLLRKKTRTINFFDGLSFSIHSTE